jgi:lipopolysaccharide transport system ATP-binding protein
MSLRLAFAVAAHLQPEILIVDEVLAVGDAAFQERCLSRMNSMASSGRTVLFVSHQMQAIANLCNNAIELQNGRATYRGNARDVVNHYLAAMASSTTSDRTWTLETAPGDEVVRLLRVRVEDPSGHSTPTFQSDEPISVLLEVQCFDTPTSLCVGFDLLTSDGTHVLRSYHNDVPLPYPRLAVGRNLLRCQIPPGLLNGISYRVCPRIGLHNLKWCVKEDSVVEFQVELMHGKSPFWNALSGTARGGAVAPIFDWQKC